MPPAKSARIKASERDTAPLIVKVELAEGDERNLCCCPQSSCLRVAVGKLVKTSSFDGFILLIILANCVMMANSSPLIAPPPIFKKLELIFNCIFTVEMTLKIIAFGLNHYMSDGWNMLDVTVVSTAWLPYLLPGVGNYSAIRAVRVLRALRTVNRIPSLKKIIRTLLSAIPELYNVSLLFCFFLFLFGIIGVTLFSGKLHYRCTEPGSDEWVNEAAICDPQNPRCDGEQTCEFYETNPANGAVSYDNCLWAFVTIFQAVSLEGWVDQMYMLERVVEPHLTIAYYILVVVFGAMFIVNLFLAVIFDAFLAGRGEGEEEAAEEPAEKRPPLKLDAFESIIYFLIVANTVTMCLEYNGMSDQLSEFLNTCNLFFVFAFTGEMVFKLRSLGLKSYFNDSWNCFDFLVTNASVLDLLLDMWHHDTDFLRALRVARVLRLLRLNKNMQRFEATFNKVFVPMINMSMVLILIIVVFAMLGMELFGGKLGAVPPRTNFDYFSNSFITTFVVTSGENWNDVFADSLDVGSPLLSVMYFVPLFITGNYVLVNLFVAIICWGWDKSVDTSEIDTGGPETDEEHSLVEDLKLKLSRERSNLQSEHADLMLALQELISERALGFSATFGSRLMSQMMSHMKDFNTKTDDAPIIRADQLEELAGITVGFTSLVKGLGLMLDDRGAGVQRAPELALLCEYWDSEHARTTGAPSGTANAKISLQLILKRYITTITANKKLMKEVADVRMDERDKRNAGRFDERSVPQLALQWAEFGFVAPKFGELVEAPRLSEALAKGKTEFSPSEFAAFQSSTFSVKQLKYSSYVKAGKKYFKAAGPDTFGHDHLPLKPDTAQSGPCIRQLRAIVTASSFQNFIMFCIICSSLSLAFDMPSVLPGSETAITLELLDVLFTTIFVVEMSLKIIAFGAFSPPDGYFRDGWNQLDSFIVMTSVISLLAAGVEYLSVFRSMRAVRTLRPLRVIQRNPNLKQVVNSFLRALPGMFHISTLCLIVLIVYGRFMMQFLSGRMGSCNDGTVLTKPACVGTFVTDEGVTLARWWGNDDIGNFDNIFYAMLTLFEMSTLEMWPDLMFRAMDADPSGPDQPLRLNVNPWMAFYLITWIVLSAFFLLNLFVGVVLENFNAIREAEDGSGMMSDTQKEWTRTITSILSIKPEKALRVPGGRGSFAKLRKSIFMLVQGDSQNPNDPQKRIPVAFEKFIITLVLLNVLSMALSWYRQPDYMTSFAEAADIFFTVAFTIEMVLKITGLGLRQYLLSWWNRFDAVLVNGALVADALQSLESLGIKVDPATLRLMRIFRIMRLLRLMKVSPGLNRLISTIFVAAPALYNVGILLFIFMYIYTILGVELFHKLPLNGEFINEDANFASFGVGMMTLLRCVTGESYNGLMHDAMITEAWSAPGRCSDAEGTCGSPVASVVFFISFFILESLVMLNLIVAVVLDAFAEEDKAQYMSLPGAAMDEFVDAWKELDREATAYMETKNLRTLLFSLKQPYGFADYVETKGAKPTAAEVTGRLVDLDIPDRQGKVAFHDVLEAIGRVAVGPVELPAGSSAEKALRQKYSDVLKQTGLHNTEVTTGAKAAHIFHIIRLQSAFRRRKALKKQAAARAQAALANGAAASPDGASKAAGGSPNGNGKPAAANGNSFDARARKAVGGGGSPPGGAAPSGRRASERGGAVQKKASSRR